MLVKNCTTCANAPINSSADCINCVGNHGNARNWQEKRPTSLAKTNRPLFCGKCVCVPSSRACGVCSGYNEYIPAEKGVSMAMGQEEVRRYFEAKDKFVEPKPKSYMQDCTTCANRPYMTSTCCSACKTTAGFKNWKSGYQLETSPAKGNCLTCIHRKSNGACLDCQNFNKFEADITIKLTSTPINCTTISTIPDQDGPNRLRFADISQCATCFYLTEPLHKDKHCEGCDDNSHYREMGDHMMANAVEKLNTIPLGPSLSNDEVEFLTPAVSSLAETLAAREDAYGDYLTKCQTIWAMKHAMHATPNWEAMPVDMKETLSMIQHKIGRILHGQIDHIDSWHDIQGYAKLIEDRLKKDYRK